MTITLEDFERRLAEAGGGALRRLTRETLQRAAKEAERAAKLRVTGGNPLHTRSGRLRSSIRSGIRGPTAQGFLEGYLQAGGTSSRGQVKYARIHEEGGTIVPKNKKFLTIPVGPAKTGASVARVSARQVPGLAYVQSLKGQPLLAHQDTGAVWFILRKRVEIPKRPFLAPSIRDAAKQLPAALAPLLARSLRADL